MRGLLKIVAMSLVFLPGIALASLPEALFEPQKNSKSLVLTLAVRPVMSPFAHVRFCMQHPTQCSRQRVSLRKPKVALTQQRLAELEGINRSVNASIVAQPDPGGPFNDRWTLFPKAGDCDDYAVSKRARLLELGWPSSSLLLAQLSHTAEESHLVLVVRTSGGSFVLDNLANSIRPLKTVAHRIEKIQSATAPELWLRPVNPQPELRVTLLSF